MKIKRHDDGYVILDQTAKILEAFKISEAKSATPPLDPNIPSHKVEDNRWKNIKEESAKIYHTDKPLEASCIWPVEFILSWPMHPLHELIKRQTR
ncbi:hypothetical protein AVEN_185791-1 [Araneus ventricosus]|uniref:Uncharacterized protein n=1 Tax=Araneus ventricosus TaxID=182803 RepID=A0A4Y2HID3_ARAVE|nr:hypothetical protein AVEN_185791-1 [Araneus ventricosus]